MNIHSYEKIWLVVAILLIVGFISTVTYGATAVGIDMVDDEGGTVNASALDEDPRFSEPRVEQVGDNEYEAYVIAQQYIFNPDPIRVPANSTVTFFITSPDVIHGFEIVGTNANTMVIPGQVAKITVNFNDPGEYGIVCHEYCGSGHHTMEGSVVVQPEDEFEPGGDE
ncbi:cytochrome c oxidase subunit II [Halonotius pteroides]|uniref:Cytochrome C oxidase subunit II n=1 Tax=Halonotius pteroides TaxID=268735 RepID=A0A3A6Q7J4_9EURY|nr:cytochrome c oxidase subunit II [Halonotius pteroides]RJX49904.1 cytochrome C oxidase subunit II [Halonotius pteroides]